MTAKKPAPKPASKPSAKPVAKPAAKPKAKPCGKSPVTGRAGGLGQSTPSSRLAGGGE